MVLHLVSSGVNERVHKKLVEPGELRIVYHT